MNLNNSELSNLNMNSNQNNKPIQNSISGILTNKDIEYSILSTIIKILISRKWIEDDYDKYYNILINNLVMDNIELIDIAFLETLYKKIVIKFYKSKLQTIKNDREIDIFLNDNINNHKILIVNDITTKAEKQIIELNNIEVFKTSEVIKNIAEHHLVPKHILLNKEEAAKVLDEYKLKKKDMGRIYIDDMMVRYLYAKKDDVIQIIRPSIYSGYSTYYRLVVNNSIYN